MQKANQTPVFSLLFVIYMAWNSVWLSLKFCVTLWHMSIYPRVSIVPQTTNSLTSRTYVYIIYKRITVSVCFSGKTGKCRVL